MERSDIAEHDPVRKSPCGCPLLLFPMKDGPKRPICIRRIARNDRIFSDIPASVWCGIRHGWVNITDAQYEEFTCH